MRQHFAIFLTVTLVVVVLVAIYSASYVRIEQTPDSEYNPDRSTYNGAATGTRAFYDYLRESGSKVMRWREPPASLLAGEAGVGPETFVVVGDTRVAFEPEEIDDLLTWVQYFGGHLVIIDRTPDARLLPAAGNWRVGIELQAYPSPDARPDSADDMTAGVALARVVQPTSLTYGVDSALPSRFASTIKVWTDDAQPPQPGSSHGTADEDAEDDEDAIDEESGARVVPPKEAAPPPPAPPRQSTSPGAKGTTTTETADGESSPAPVVHMTGTKGALLVDYAYGAGRIIVLSDPFIVANGGINRADNLRLALNTVANGSGLIAFDEYHQGRAVTENQLIAYFAGTPVLAMIGQLGLLALVVVWSRGRRFARPLPLPSVDRRSKLEFVASMAELQQRARAYDLAIENIYVRTRRVLARYAGLDSNSPRALIAERVAARSKLKAGELEALMRECEDAMAGEQVGARRALQLVARLREVERSLGLRMRAREIKQAKAK